MMTDVRHEDEFVEMTPQYAGDLLATLHQQMMNDNAIALADLPATAETLRELHRWAKANELRDVAAAVEGIYAQFERMSRAITTAEQYSSNVRKIVAVFRQENERLANELHDILSDLDTGLTTNPKVRWFADSIRDDLYEVAYDNAYEQVDEEIYNEVYHVLRMAIGNDEKPYDKTRRLVDLLTATDRLNEAQKAKLRELAELV